MTTMGDIVCLTCKQDSWPAYQFSRVCGDCNDKAQTAIQKAAELARRAAEQRAFIWSFARPILIGLAIGGPLVWLYTKLESKKE